MFLKNCWYVAAWDHELIDGRLLARTLLEQRVLLYKGDSGQVVALADRCCHRGVPLHLGRREGDYCIRCMYHGLKFDATGKCVQIPGQEMVPARLGVRSYPVVVRDHLVWIWMGDAALADPDQILDYPFLRDPQWKGIPDYLHYKANYLLIVDNLSDFAHLAFVHTHTLGGSEEYAYTTKPVSMERLERGSRVERWHMNAPPQGDCGPAAQCRSTQHRAYAHTGCLLPGIAFRACRRGRREGQPGGRPRVPQLPVHDARDPQHHPLLLELPEQLRGR